MLQLRIQVKRSLNLCDWCIVSPYKEKKNEARYLLLHEEKLLKKVGLPEVRQFRLNQCILDETEWRKQLQVANDVMPEIRPLLLLRVLPGGA